MAAESAANSTRRDSRALYLRLLSYVRPHARIFGISILVMVATAATEPLFPALLKPLLDGCHAAGAFVSYITPLSFSLALLGLVILRRV